MINAILRILGYKEESTSSIPCGNIIARNDRLNEIMVEEPDGAINRYKKVDVGSAGQPWLRTYDGKLK